MTKKITLLGKCTCVFNGFTCFFSTVRCARRGITRTSSCCVMAVTKAATLTVTNPKSLVSQRETGTARPAYPRYQSILLCIVNCPQWLICRKINHVKSFSAYLYLGSLGKYPHHRRTLPMLVSESKYRYICIKAADGLYYVSIFSFLKANNFHFHWILSCKDLHTGYISSKHLFSAAWTQLLYFYDCHKLSINIHSD